MKTLIILSLIYIISALSMYFLIRKRHSKGGTHEGYSLSWHYFIATIIPLGNTIILILLSLDSLSDSLIDLITSREFLDKFFKIKR